MGEGVGGKGGDGERVASVGPLWEFRETPIPGSRLPPLVSGDGVSDLLMHSGWGRAALPLPHGGPWSPGHTWDYMDSFGDNLYRPHREDLSPAFNLSTWALATTRLGQRQNVGRYFPFSFSFLPPPPPPPHPDIMVR